MDGLDNAGSNCSVNTHCCEALVTYFVIVLLFRTAEDLPCQRLFLMCHSMGR